tara:strand:+ start:6326 stop:6826 length:501 start_codon:yes stop_codon:yes gene_type:complete
MTLQDDHTYTADGVLRGFGKTPLTYPDEYYYTGDEGWFVGGATTTPKEKSVEDHLFSEQSVEDYRLFRKAYKRPYPTEVPEQSKEDVVNAPSHYNNGKVECIDAMEAMLTKEEFIGYLRGNTFKYQWRCRYKGKTSQDLRKATWYLHKLMEVIGEDTKTSAEDASD